MNVETNNVAVAGPVGIDAQMASIRYDENGNPIIPVGNNEAEKEVFVQTEEVVN